AISKRGPNLRNGPLRKTRVWVKERLSTHSKGCSSHSSSTGPMRVLASRSMLPSGCGISSTRYFGVFSASLKRAVSEISGHSASAGCSNCQVHLRECRLTTVPCPLDEVQIALQFAAFPEMQESVPSYSLPSHLYGVTSTTQKVILAACPRGV